MYAAFIWIARKKLVAVAIIMQLSAEKIRKELLLMLQSGNLSNNMVTIFVLLNVSLGVKAAHLEKHVDAV